MFGPRTDSRPRLPAAFTPHRAPPGILHTAMHLRVIRCEHDARSAAYERYTRVSAPPAATRAARALLDRAVRDRANAYGGSLALGTGWEEYLLPRVAVLADRNLPDGALLRAVTYFGADAAVALECSTRGLRQ